MKKLFILLLVVLAAGTWIGQMMVQDPGYVLVAFNQTTIETSVWVLLVVLLVGFLLAHWGLNLLTNAMMPVHRLRDWRDRRNHNVSQRKTLKGLMALSEGNWARAQRQLGQAAERSELPLINYLAAARAAHEQGDERAADDLLQKARSTTPQAEVAVGIAQAEMQLSRGQLEPCLANLLKMRKLAPKNTYIMRLLKDVYAKLNDWDAIASLLPELKRSQAVREEGLVDLERQTYMNLLTHSLEQLPVETDNASRHSVLDKAWQKLPQNLSGEPALIRRYIELLISINAEPKAEKVLREMIANAERRTAGNTRLTVSVCANYGGRWDIMQATGKMVAANPGVTDYTEDMLAPHLAMAYAPEPDLFIRTGGEERISNFLLWQLAYSELYFTDTYWPDFSVESLDAAIASYQHRERRFGRTGEQVAKKT